MKPLWLRLYFLGMLLLIFDDWGDLIIHLLVFGSEEEQAPSIRQCLQLLVVFLDALLTLVDGLLPLVLGKLVLLVKLLAVPDQVEDVPLLLVEALSEIPPNVVGRQDQLVSSLVHEIPESRLVSLDHLIFKIYLPWSEIGFTWRANWLKCRAICLHEHFGTLSLSELILNPNHIPHVGRAINVLVGNGWIIISPGFFVNLVHCLIHLRNLVQRALYRGLTGVECTTSQL